MSLTWALLTILALVPLLINAQIDCSKAPTASLRTVCEQIQNWDKNARSAPQPNKQGIVLPPGIDAKEIGAANFELVKSLYLFNATMNSESLRSQQRRNSA